MGNWYQQTHPQPPVGTPEYDEYLRNAGILQRQVPDNYNAANQSQGALSSVQSDRNSRLVDPTTSYASGVAKDRRETPPAKPLTANRAGQAIGTGAEAALDNVIIPGAKMYVDTAKDAGLGVLNFARGVGGMEELEAGQRYRDQKPPSGRTASDVDLSGVFPTGALTQYGLDANTTGKRDPDTGEVIGLGPAPMPEINSPVLAVERPTASDQGINPAIPALNGQEVTNYAGPLTADKGVLEKIAEAASGDRQANTGNKRDKAGLSVPRNRNNIDLSEMLIRTGGAITGASGDGALAAIGAGTNAYGGVMDENRRLEQVQYENDQKEYQAEEDRKIQRMAARGGSAAAIKAAKEDEDMLLGNTAKVKIYDSLIDDLALAGDNVTGMWDGIGGKFLDNATGHPNANLRLRMQDVRVDAALAKVAQTKGAISDREMSLFLSPMPTMTSSEEVWIDWMTMQRNVTQILNDRMSGKTKVETGSDLSSDLQAYANKYPDQRTTTDTLLSKYGIN
jgi:hypothetical protein